jgi:hypothetical protein
MARAARDRQFHEWTGGYLTYLVDVCAVLPGLAGEWGRWDESSRLTFVVNWSVPSDRFHQLRQWAEQGLLSPAQRARHEQLLRLMEEHGPLLARLLADDCGAEQAG